MRKMVWEKADLTDEKQVKYLLKKYKPDVIIHCAGIAHQKIGAVALQKYIRINGESTEMLAKSAFNENPKALFIFLSSISVYGEKECAFPIPENSEYQPTSDYAISKTDAESRLLKLAHYGSLCNTFFLRLAPVYDKAWRLNLNRRVLAPNGVAYVKFGSGHQQMSALALDNLIGFIDYILNKIFTSTSFDYKFFKESKTTIINVCDASSYKFSDIIKIFKQSDRSSIRPVISIPLKSVYILIRILGILMPNKKQWLHSCYKKISTSMIFDNKKMLETGFIHASSLETVFLEENQLIDERVS